MVCANAATMRRSRGFNVVIGSSVGFEVARGLVLRGRLGHQKDMRRALCPVNCDKPRAESTYSMNFIRFLQEL